MKNQPYILCFSRIDGFGWTSREVTTFREANQTCLSMREQGWKAESCTPKREVELNWKAITLNGRFGCE